AAGGLNFAEIGVTSIGNGVAQNRVIERVEHLETEVQALPLGERERLMQSRVIGEGRWPAKDIIAERAVAVLRVRRRNVERRRVEPGQRVSVFHIGIYAQNEVRTIGCAPPDAEQVAARRYV